MSVKQKFRSNISIVILNWNGWKDTIECLESLFHINYPHYQIVVVDNGSQDSSVQRIRDYLNGQISIKLPFLKNHTNFFLHPMQEYSLDEINSDSFTLRNDSLDILVRYF